MCVCLELDLPHIIPLTFCVAGWQGAESEVVTLVTSITVEGGGVCIAHGPAVYSVVCQTQTSFAYSIFQSASSPVSSVCAAQAKQESAVALDLF